MVNKAKNLCGYRVVIRTSSSVMVRTLAVADGLVIVDAVEHEYVK